MLYTTVIFLIYITKKMCIAIYVDMTSVVIQYQ